MTIVPTNAKGMAMWRKKIFVALARNAATPIEHFDLPALADGDDQLRSGHVTPPHR